jgi:hypothetical protein
MGVPEGAKEPVAGNVPDVRLSPPP